MHDWMNWLIMAAILVILELFSGTFYLLMVALGMAAGGLIAFGGGQLEWQMLVAGIVGSIATVLLRRSRFGGGGKVKASRDPNVNLDIGQLVQVAEWQRVAPERYTARCMYRGAHWDVEFIGAAAVQPGAFRIVEVRGCVLIVQQSV